MALCGKSALEEDMDLSWGTQWDEWMDARSV